MAEKDGRTRAETGDTAAVALAQLPGYLGYQVRQAQAAVFRDFVPLMEGVHVTPGEFSLLTLVDANPGVSQIDLARVYRLDKSTLSHAVNKLEKRGLVRRAPGARDRRYTTLRLTDAGKSVLAEATARVESQERAMDRVLHPGEREALLDMLERVSRAFEG